MVVLNGTKRCHGQRCGISITISRAMVIQSGGMAMIRSQSGSTKKDLQSKTVVDVKPWGWIFCPFPTYFFFLIHQHYAERFLASSFSSQLSKVGHLLIECLPAVSGTTRTHCHLWEAGEHLPSVCHWVSWNSWNYTLFPMSIWRQYSQLPRNERYEDRDEPK